MQLFLLLFALATAVISKPVEETDQSLLWGPYRPNLYFGVRPRLPQSLMTGLIWFSTVNYQSIQRSRHTCEQDDKLDSYTWSQYDPREGGVQEIKDSQNNVKITTEFLKVLGGKNGGSWAARIKGEPVDTSKPMHISTVFYTGLEGLGGLEMRNEPVPQGFEGPVTFIGSTPDLDDFTIRIEDGPKNIYVGEASLINDAVGRTGFAGYQVEQGNIWQAKKYIMDDIFARASKILEPFHSQEHKDKVPNPAFSLQVSNSIQPGSNLYVVQKTFSGPFQFDVFYESASANHQLDAESLDQGIPALTSAFTTRFKSIFPIPPSNQTTEKFSQAITSNLLGGIGYFYGSSIEDRGFSYEWDEDGETEDETPKGPKLTEPRELFTATPSRSFFPRGFYWDEGFHLLHIGAWDNALSLEVLKDWINLVDEDGWVGREQILGEEARSRVPKEFQTQVPTFANPPTLAMAVTAFIGRLKGRSSGPSDFDLGMGMGDGSAQVRMSDNARGVSSLRDIHLEDQKIARKYLNAIYLPLRRHYEWFRRTQRGHIKRYGRKARSNTEGYRWRGRSETHVLTSGMDDFPRAPAHPGELHLDLIAWMGFFSRTMKEIAEFIDEEDDAEAFAENENAIIQNIDDLHWSEKDQMYCDLGIDQEDDSYHECHRGYLSLFPLLLSLIDPSSPHLGAVLDLMSDPRHLWSPYGIRSLSLSHPEFGKGEDYWKGAIWMPMNYMALSALHGKYASVEGPYREQAKKIYAELRTNIIDNVFKEYERTGYVWEQYNAETGEGRRSHPFTGWTSLVTLIISEKY
ncbi:glycoside hydrolase family 63 protein [Thelephora ganbajun]|uniref:Glycoside hydrolase family 63 protein n=1 Tax=Thelephora ganbajun TaxID=370292 RepID=A0ACB6ZUM2_THEGA|nr:glycoside hydrolase family 63 protein [Thelephora ganbajun]